LRRVVTTSTTAVIPIIIAHRVLLLRQVKMACLFD
jgi:hypothetical protein